MAIGLSPSITLSTRRDLIVNAEWKQAMG